MIFKIKQRFREALCMKSKTFLWLLAGKELNGPVALPCQGLPLSFFSPSSFYFS